jgi:CHASE3 domain sensor protein
MEPRTFAGFLVALAAVLIIAVLSYDSLRLTERAAGSLTHAVEVLAQIQSLASTLKDAETGQRGFLLTGRENYLEPYLAAKQALPGELANVRALLADDPAQRGRFESLQALASDKMQELTETIDLKRAGKADAALALVLTDRGKSSMDRIRLMVDEMQNQERQLITQRAEEWRKSATLAFAVTSGGSAVLLFLIAGSAAIASRDFRARQREAWIRAGQLGLSGLMQGDLPLDRLGDNILRYLSEYLDAQVGALFIAEGGGFRRVAGFALAGAFETGSLRPGDGLAGQAAKNNRLLRIRDVPHDYLQVSSATGAAAPAELLIAPASIDGRVYAVLELGFFGEVSAAKAQLLERAS